MNVLKYRSLVVPYSIAVAAANRTPSVQGEMNFFSQIARARGVLDYIHQQVQMLLFQAPHIFASQPPPPDHSPVSAKSATASTVNRLHKTA